MRVAIVLALAVAALAQTPPRPNIAPNFYADVEVEFHRGEEPTLFGDGVYLVDYFNKKLLEDYRFKVEGHIGHFYSYNLQRFDLKESFRIESFDLRECSERVLNETEPKPFDWIKNASYQGKDEFRHVEVDIWGVHYGDLYARVGVVAPHWDEPVFVEEMSAGGHEGMRIFFRHYVPNATIESKYFDIPQECQAFSAPAAPTGPKIAGTFISEFDVEVDRAGRGRFHGEGKWASSEKAQAEANEVSIDGDHHEFMYDLTLFKEHKTYEIGSEDHEHCITRPNKFNWTNPFAWTEKASFVGKHSDPRIGTVDIYQYHFGGANLTIGVEDKAKNIPLFYGRESAGTRMHAFFRHFEPVEPPAEAFEVPRPCQHNTTNTKPLRLVAELL